VSVEHAKAPGMRDFVVVPHSHPFLMRADAVLNHVEAFLATGRFRTR